MMTRLFRLIVAPRSSWRIVRCSPSQFPAPSCIAVPRARRRGVTLVELLIVVAIIAILFGILFPALQIARESARRRACSNNLRQLALAMAAYGDVHKELPGWRNTIESYSSVRAASDPKTAAVSWTVPILPHIEAASIQQWYASYSAPPTGANNPSQSRIRTYYCPSHGLVDTPPGLSYAVNAGTGGEVLDETGSPARQYVGDGVFPDAVGNISGTPLFDPSRSQYAPEKLKVRHIAPDGTTSTIMLTERSGADAPPSIVWSANPRVAKENRGALPENHGVLHPLPVGSGWRTEIRVINPTAATRPEPAPVPANADLDDWTVRYPSSRHPSAVNVAFCDGHVRVVRNGIDAWVYCQILSSNSRTVSSGVADWQQRFDDSGSLVPYTFNPADLIR